MKCGILWVQVEESGVTSMFFIGTYYHSLDEKSRVTLPSKLREKLGSSVYINLGLDKCLAIYTEETFNKLVEEISSKSLFNPQVRSYKRIFFANSYQCDIDKQGRIQLNKEIKEKCSIDKDVVIIGIDDHIEIWDTERFAKMEEDNEANYEENASSLYEGM